MVFAFAMVLIRVMVFARVMGFARVMVLTRDGWGHGSHGPTGAKE